MKINSATLHYQELVKERARIEQHKQHLKKLEETRWQECLRVQRARNLELLRGRLIDIKV